MAHSADIVQLAPEELLLMKQRYEEMVRRHTGLIRRVCVLRSGGSYKEMTFCIYQTSDSGTKHRINIQTIKDLKQ